MRSTLKSKLVYILWLAVLVAMMACTDDPAAPGVTAEIGPEGGSVRLPDGAEVRFPPGALVRRSSVNLRRVVAPLSGFAPEGASRIGDSEVQLRIDPEAVVGRWEATLLTPRMEVDPARLYIADIDDGTSRHADEPVARYYSVLWTTVTPADASMRLTVRRPPPRGHTVQLSPWLAEQPVVREGIGTAYGPAGSGGGGGASPLFEYAILLRAPMTELVDRARRVMPEVEGWFRGVGLSPEIAASRGLGYRVPSVQQPVSVTLAFYQGAIAGFCPAPRDELCAAAPGVNYPGSGIVLNLRPVFPVPDPGMLEMAAAHELFHAYQYWSVGGTSLTDSPWVREGSASLMMGEAYDAFPGAFTCMDLTLTPLEEDRGGCAARAYETGLFFRWLGAPAVREIFTGTQPVNLTQATLQRLDGRARPDGDPQTYFSFAQNLLYLKRFDRTDTLPDARGVMLGEDREDRVEEFNIADMYSSCRLGEPFARPQPGAGCPGPSGTLEAFQELRVSDGIARAGSVQDLGRRLDHLSAYRYDLSNQSGRRQRLMVEVEHTGALPGRVQARVYRRGEPTAQMSLLGSCDSAGLLTRMSCVYDDEGPGTGLMDGTRVMVIANNHTTGASNGSFRGTYRVLPVRLRSAAMNSGNGQSGRPATALPLPFVVETLDRSDTPMGSVRVTWEVLEGGGSVSVREGRSATGSGRAETVLTLGPRPGVNRVRAHAYNLPDPMHPLYRELQDSPVDFVTGDSPRIRMALTSNGNGQSGVPGSALVLPFAVEVVDAMDMGLGGIRVTWESSGGAGSVSPRENRSAVGTGRAESLLTLGPVFATHRVLARGYDLRDVELTGSPVVFSTASAFSCNFVMGPVHQCSDFEVPTMGVEEQRRGCTGAGRTFSEVPCDRRGSVGGCRLNLPMGSSTAWYYGAPFTPEIVRGTCAAIGGTFVAP